MTRRPNQFLQDRFEWGADNGSTAATLTVKVRKARAAFVIDRITYINPTGLASDATNAFTGVVKIGATTAATLFDTDSDTGAALAADTFITGALVTGALNGNADDIVSLVLTKFGTQTLPAGKVIIEGRYL